MPPARESPAQDHHRRCWQPLIFRHGRHGLPGALACRNPDKSAQFCNQAGDQAIDDLETTRTKGSRAEVACTSAKAQEGNRCRPTPTFFSTC